MVRKCCDTPTLCFNGSWVVESSLVGVDWGTVRASAFKMLRNPSLNYVAVVTH